MHTNKLARFHKKDHETLSQNYPQRHGISRKQLYWYTGEIKSLTSWLSVVAFHPKVRQATPPPHQAPAFLKLSFIHLRLTVAIRIISDTKI